MINLIINADDFGLTQGINAAVIRAHKQGALTSATLMAGGLAWREAVELSKQTPSLGVGVHLTLTALGPVTPPQQVPSLVDKRGRFRRQFWRVLVWSRNQVKSEWRGQIERLLKAGLTPTHLDSHHHIHLWPPLTNVICELAEEFGLAGVRVIGPASFKLLPASFVQRRLAALSWRRSESYSVFKPNTVTALEIVGGTEQDFTSYCRQLGPGTHELFTHPGSPNDEELAAISSLTAKRKTETDLLCSDWLQDSLKAAGIVLANYKTFGKERV